MVVLAFFGSRRKILALFISSGRMTSAFFFFGGNISEQSILNVWVCVQGVVSLRARIHLVSGDHEYEYHPCERRSPSADILFVADYNEAKQPC